MRVLVTGATGFVGQRVCQHLRTAGHVVLAAARTESDSARVPEVDQFIAIGDIDGTTDWSTALVDIDAVVHLAAATHRGDLEDPRAADLYNRVNVAGTRALAEQSATAGVERFLFMSSIKANANVSPIDNGRVVALSGDTPPTPQDNYGRSKLAAEREVLAHSTMMTTVLRPPLVYGPGQKGNLARVASWLRRGIPLPFASIRNRRSLIYVGNLADAVVCSLTVDTADGVFTLADSELSTPNLIRALASGLGFRARLLPCPPPLLRAGLSIVGHGPKAERLLDSLLVDDTNARTALGWTPRVSLDEAMRFTGESLRVSGGPLGEL